MGRKSQSKQSAKEKPDKEKIRRVRQLFGLSERILRLTSVIPGAESSSSLWERHQEVSKLLDEVLALERADRKPASYKRTDGIAAFTAWLKENGAQFDGVEICAFPDYELGLRATRAFAEGSPVLSVPRRLMMTEEEAHQSALASFMQGDPLLGSMPNVALALFLLLEKHNPESQWKPYLDILPESYTTVLYFTNQQLLQLKPSPVFEQSLKLCRSIARQYSYLSTKMQAEAPGTAALRDFFTYEGYRWAVSTVMTRQNSVNGVSAFIPLWDLCNHEHGRITTDYNPELARSECYALRDFAAGEQILIFYGVRSNADLFLHNGFVYPDNRQDTTTLSLGTSADDPLREQRLAVLAKLGLSGVTRFSLHVAPEGSSRTPLSPELLAFARVFSMNSDELASCEASSLVSLELTNESLDRRAHSYLNTRCALLTALYRKCQAADATNPEESTHLRNVRLLKESELSILQHAMRHCQHVLQQLDATPAPA